MKGENKNKFFLQAQKKEKKERTKFGSGTYNVPQSKERSSNFSYTNVVEENNNNDSYSVTVPGKKAQIYSDVKQKYAALLESQIALNDMLKNIQDIHTAESQQWQESPVGRYLLCETKIAAYEKENLQGQLSNETINIIKNIQNQCNLIWGEDSVLSLFLEYDLFCAEHWQALDDRIENLITANESNNNPAPDNNDRDFYRLMN